WCALHVEPRFEMGIRTNNGVEVLNSSLKNVYMKSHEQVTLSTTDPVYRSHSALPIPSTGHTQHYRSRLQVTLSTTNPVYRSHSALPIPSTGHTQHYRSRLQVTLSTTDPVYRSHSALPIPSTITVLTDDFTP
ncbi:hypothetical protein LSAT2_030756, partial [Lamellibrachia satsuma]